MTPPSGHLPECRALNEDADIPDEFRDCICDRLRACEQRTLDAARQAVAAVEDDPDAEVDYDRDYSADQSGNTRNARIWLHSAFSAIDALRHTTD